ncbi:magnesium/cobalt transporter CorA [Pseudomonadota bacterium]
MQLYEIYYFDKSSRQLKIGNEELLNDWRDNADASIWLNFIGRNEDLEKQFLQATFGLHPLAIKDAMRNRHPPKLEAFENNTFLLLKELAADSTEIHFATEQLALFIGERFLVTRSSGESVAARLLAEEIQQNHDFFAQGCDNLAIRLCRIAVDHYLGKLLSLEPRLEELEREVMEHPADSILAELLNYKTQLKKFRRVFLYHEQIFRELRDKQFPAVSQALSHEINDLHEHQERAVSLTLLYYELASDLADGYLSVASHRLNQIMKVLTVIMAIFVPLSFLAGIYGMNFENMPELHSKSGYFILLSLMGSIAIVLLFLFKRKRWL